MQLEDPVYSVKYWQQPRSEQGEYCPRCGTSGHGVEAHFDRCAFDTAAVPELSGVELLHQLVDGR